MGEDNNVRTNVKAGYCMKKRVWILECILVLCLLTGCTDHEGAALTTDGRVFTSLFDGMTLDGWNVYETTSIVEDSPRWRVVDGVIVGSKVDDPKPDERCGNVCGNTWLVSENQYDDFVLRFKFRILNGNSGFTYRSVIGAEALNSPEVDLAKDGDTTGQIYVTTTINNDYLHKDYLTTVDPDVLSAAFKLEGFNQMEVQLKGMNVKVYLNGTQLTDFNHNPSSDSGRKRGFIAMELHELTAAEFKDIEISEL